MFIKHVTFLVTVREENLRFCSECCVYKTCNVSSNCQREKRTYVSALSAVFIKHVTFLVTVREENLRFRSECCVYKTCNVSSNCQREKRTYISVLSAVL